MYKGRIDKTSAESALSATVGMALKCAIVRAVDVSCSDPVMGISVGQSVGTAVGKNIYQKFGFFV